MMTHPPIALMLRVFALLIIGAIYAPQFNAQSAAIYDFSFDVAPALRNELPKYDAAGRAKGEYVRGEWVPETVRETLSSRYVTSICETLQAALIETYGYEEVAILYPGNLSMTVHPSRMNGFPKWSLKKSMKKHAANHYVECQIQIKGRSSGTLIVMNKQREASLKFAINIQLTVYDTDGNIIDEKSIAISDFTREFKDSHVARLEDEFTRVLGIGHLSQSDMERLFLSSLQQLLH